MLHPTTGLHNRQGFFDFETVVLDNLTFDLLRPARAVAVSRELFNSVEIAPAFSLILPQRLASTIRSDLAKLKFEAV